MLTELETANKKACNIYNHFLREAISDFHRGDQDPIKPTASFPEKEERYKQFRTWLLKECLLSPYCSQYIRDLSSRISNDEDEMRRKIGYVLQNYKIDSVFQNFQTVRRENEKDLHNGVRIRNAEKIDSLMNSIENIHHLYISYQPIVRWETSESTYELTKTLKNIRDQLNSCLKEKYQ